MKSLQITVSAFILAAAFSGCATTNINTRPGEESYFRTASAEGCDCAKPATTAAGDRTTEDEKAFFTGTESENPRSRNGSTDAAVSADNKAAESAPAHSEETPARIQNNVTIQRNPEGGYFDDSQRTAQKEAESAPRQEVVADNTTPAVVPASTTAGVVPGYNENGEFSEVGTASWYGRDFNGKPTASGEPFDARKLTAAHKRFPLGSLVLVRNMENGRELLVTVNDRGPFVRGRILDLSEYAAELLGYKERGLTTVGVKLVRAGNVSERGLGATAGFYSASGSDAVGGGSNEDETRLRRQQQELINRPAQQRPPEAAESFPAETTQQAYSIQLGVFTEAAKAREFLGSLSSYGQPVQIYTRGSQFVVRAGRFDTRRAAEEFKARLTNAGLTGFITAPAQ